ncbi:MAG: pyridoxine 5'-phosphate synthase [Candidatus Omnitrophica bacterium]|nr:pyridoxine 5'-phosphate synthase [Candidatus Omnitrophota bacterium]MCK5494113.1 pyridoxine 5'-phosphate synthase [Candidatus Omnitrophota bacterium]
MKLGVNVDHVSTLREARGTLYPDPVEGALLAESAGCDSIVAHLREDRRHIKERDIIGIKEAIKIPLNLEMSVNKNIVSFAQEICPYQSTFVPERRQELTTEGGIDLVKNYKKVYDVIKKLKKSGIRVSLFIDPLIVQIKAAKDLGADIIEINTGRFSETKTVRSSEVEIRKITKAAIFSKKQGFFVSAGHGLDYENVKEISKIEEIEELNIGHSIMSRSVFVGIVSAVREMFFLIGK